MRKLTPKKSSARRAADVAAKKLRAAGYKIEEPTSTKRFRPLDVPGLNLSAGLRKARGK